MATKSRFTISTATRIGKFGKKNPDLNLFGDTNPRKRQGRGQNGNTRRALHVELHESKPVQELLGKLSRKGLPVEHYEAQDKPLFELIEGDDERVHPVLVVGHPRHGD